MRPQEERTAIRRRFHAVDTTIVADVLDRRGLMHQGLAPEFEPYSGRNLAGWAYTIRGQMAPYEAAGDPEKLTACQNIGADEISVWSGDGTGVCYFGELIALGMMERGSVGALVDGGIRDIRWLREHGFPVFARYRTPIQSIGRWLVTSYQEPVYLRGATADWVVVHPGDFVLADEDGALVIPARHVDDVLVAAEALSEVEVKIRDSLRSGVSLAECLERFGHL